jgi:S1-C subfamily serine protease
MLRRFLLLILALAAPAWARVATPGADGVAEASRSVVRVVVIAVDARGAVVGFGHGSGFAVAKDRIVTNAHVVEPAARYPGSVLVGIVPSRGEKAFAGRLLAIDPARDLALVGLRQGSVLPASVFSGPLDGGTDVVALGYPGSVDLATARSAQDYIRPQAPTRSEGNFSDERQVNGIHALLHTAVIGRGNSGGPLLDECGRVVGVNTFITRGDEGEAPFAFAISAGELTDFLREAGQPFAAAYGTCAPGAARASGREAGANAPPARRSSDLGALERARLAAEDAREDRLAIALLLAALGIFALAAAIVLAARDRLRAAQMFGAAGTLLLLAATAAFLTRPPREAMAPGPHLGPAETIAAG